MAVTKGGGLAFYAAWWFVNKQEVVGPFFCWFQNNGPHPTYGGSLPLPRTKRAVRNTLRERAGGWDDPDRPTDEAPTDHLMVSLDTLDEHGSRSVHRNQQLDITSSVRKRKRCMT